MKRVKEFVREREKEREADKAHERKGEGEGRRKSLSANCFLWVFSRFSTSPWAEEQKVVLRDHSPMMIHMFHFRWEGMVDLDGLGDRRRRTPILVKA